jgi:hypothetical protein
MMSKMWSWESRKKSTMLSHSSMKFSNANTAVAASTHNLTITKQGTIIAAAAAAAAAAMSLQQVCMQSKAKATAAFHTGDHRQAATKYRQAFGASPKRWDKDCW